MKIDSVHAEFMSGNAVSSASTSHSIVARDASGDIEVAGVSISGSSGTLFSYSDNTRTVYGGCDLNDPWFGTSSNHDLRLVTNGDVRMRIDKTGNVGIGTESPSTILNIKDGVFLAENQASTNNQILYGDGGGTGGNNNSYTIANAKFGTGVFVNDTGTTGSTITLVNKEGASNTTKHASIGFVTTDTTFNGKFGGQIGFWPEDANATKQQFRIYTSGTSAGYNLPVQRMVVDGDGNVGIGTTSPDTTLEVSGNIKRSGATYTKAYTYNSVSASDDLYIGRFSVYAPPAKIDIRDSGNALGSGSRFSLARHYDQTPRVQGFENSFYTTYKFHYQAVDQMTYDVWFRPDRSGNYIINVDATGFTDTTEPSSPTLTECGYDLFTADGNVGIGVASPAAKLHVETTGSSDVARFFRPNATTNSPTTIHLGRNAATNDTAQLRYVYGGSSNSSDSRIDLGFYGNGSILNITADGNVGIGTTSPSGKLNIYTGSTSTVGLSLDRYSSGNYRTDIYQNSYGPDFRVGYDTYTPSSILYLKRLSNGTKEVEINGKVHVQSVGTGTTVLIDGPTQGNSGGPNNDPWTALELHRPGTNNETYNGSVNLRAYRWATSGQDPAMALRFNLSSTAPYNTADVMTLRSDGNVGIGTTSPREKLEIADGHIALVANSWKSTGDDDQLAGKIDFYLGGSAASGQLNTPVASIEGYDKYAGGSYYGALAFKTMGSERMRINAGGYVGIGITNPNAPLHVNGYDSGSLVGVRYFNYTNGMSGTGESLSYCTLRTSHGILSGDYVAVASDERIKKNIIDADDAECLDTLRLLKPKKYRYRDEITKGADPVWGFIAQEVRETLPHATLLQKNTIPNIYELANVSSSNVITFTNFNTADLESNATTLIRTSGPDDVQHEVHLMEIIDAHSIRVEEDLSDWIGSLDESGNVVAGNQLFVYGQEVDDFVFLKKEAIWTVATAALQEVDRQQQADKVRIAELESRIIELEGMVSLIKHNMTWPDA